MKLRRKRYMKKTLKKIAKKNPMVVRLYTAIKKSQQKMQRERFVSTDNFDLIKKKGLQIWVFGANEWHANPKAIFLYMNKYKKETHKIYWVANTEHEAKKIQSIGYEAYNLNSSIGKLILSKADVYVTENFRESYPVEMNKDIIIFNTWHGVGLKHIELGLNNESVLSNGIIKKTIKNYQLYKENLLFLATSEAMEKHFINDTVVDKEQIIRAGYPRNNVYEKYGLQTYNQTEIQKRKIASYDKIILFAPTYRIKKINGVFTDLLPDLSRIVQQMKHSNGLFIFKLHPFMKNDPDYKAAVIKYKNHKNILFWDDIHDIYEFFPQIDIAIIDYSSIFYDLLEAGVERFIRYIPDYDEYTKDIELLYPYEDYTAGEVKHSFEDLLSALTHNIKPIEYPIKNKLINHFLSYRDRMTIDDMIAVVDEKKPRKQELKELHSFDIFDTLIKRKGLSPINVFYGVKEALEQSDLGYSNYFMTDYVRIRIQIEQDLRDVYRKTTYERGTNSIEISYAEIFERMAEKFYLNDEQKKYVANKEFEIELEQVESRPTQINELKQQLNQGNDVLLISDMYLPKVYIEKLLKKADSELLQLKLYVSSELGVQKSTGELYKYVFNDIEYKYAKWVHHGDNNHADGNKSRELGIEPRIHDMDSFLPFESKLIESSSMYKTHLYRISKLFQKNRTEYLLDKNSSIKHYSYAYISLVIVPYVNWAIKDAMKRKYDTLYFISRDGHYLKIVADIIIKKRSYPIKTKYIYGSRKAWRIPSFIEEVDEKTYSPFGSFVEMDSFEDVVRASQISEYELLNLVPNLKEFKNVSSYRGETAEKIRSILKNSQAYNEKLLQIAKEKRVIVKQYLQENIDFDEKFAFVEFWGRGYTQDTFTRLLCDAAGKEVENPFYYVRSISFSEGLNIRHNFSESASNFSYFEPIFATTPYKTIKEYRYTKNGEVEPVIEAAGNEYTEHIAEGISKFTEDYMDFKLKNEDDIDRILGKFVYSYHFRNPWDQFIGENLGEFKDSINSYGVPKPFAPALTPKQIRNIPVTDFSTLSGNLLISLAKSSDAARKAWEVRRNNTPQMPKLKLPKKTERKFPVNDLDLYWLPTKFPIEVKSNCVNHYYDNVNFEKKSKRDLFLDENETAIVNSLYWTHTGVVRFYTDKGFLTARKENFEILPKKKNTIK